LTIITLFFNELFNRNINTIRTTLNNYPRLLRVFNWIVNSSTFYRICNLITIGLDLIIILFLISIFIGVSLYCGFFDLFAGISYSLDLILILTNLGLVYRLGQLILFPIIRSNLTLSNYPKLFSYINSTNLKAFNIYYILLALAFNLLLIIFH